ncbi:MAG TPA: xanthine dehydrogenase family protein molybdopterin-binding subunit [Steroidobacteraceae bacterium]|nr:xanthine dehydrogenase family protein molybdopterin-binding subunit [Steroidobacteraceae bacterium]
MSGLPLLPSSPQHEPTLTRRTFLRLTTLAGAGLTLGVSLPEPVAGKGSEGGAHGRALVTPFVRIDPDNTVTVVSKHVEAGQGVWTGLPAIVAEELDAAWSQMRVESAPALVPLYGNFIFDPKGSVQGTGGSSSVANSWYQLRTAGAAARAMLVAAAAQKWQVPTREIAVRSGLVSHPSGKQATFGQLASAAGKLPVPERVALKDPASFTLIGRESLPRLDSRAKSTGTQQFAIDVILPDMKTAVVLRPPRFGAKVQSVDPKAAKALPGVVDIVQIPTGVAVVGSDMWSAKKGREALQVVWDESGAEKRGSAELIAEFKRLASLDDAVDVLKHGDVNAALAGAAHVIDAEFEFPYLAHAPMEPLNAVCKLSGDRCEIWAGAQFQTIDQLMAAMACGLKPEQVKINTLAAGGTFGRRANFESDFIAEAAAIAKATGGNYPVRVIWTREDDVTGGKYRPMNYHRVKAGVSKDGRLIAYQQRVVGQSIIAGTAWAAVMKDGVDPYAVEGSAPEQYDIPNAHVTWTNPKGGVPVLSWRSVGHSHMAYSKETIVDELAEAAGRDPVEFRLALLAEQPRRAAVLRLAAQKAGWDKPFAREKGRGRGIALQEAFNTIVAQVAEVTVTGDDIRIDRVVCAVDCGIAVTPDVVRAQMQSGIGFGLAAALHGEITLTEGRVDQTNFHQYQVLRINEMPRSVEVHIVPSKEAPTGVGEPGVPPIAPAVANAVRMATGVRLRKLPFTISDARSAKT